MMTFSMMIALVLSAILIVHSLLGKPIPFLRWSFIRMVFRMKRLTTEWQVGDGREEGAAQYVIAHAPAGDIDAAIRAIDHYAYQYKYLINVGDKKGAILDEVIKRARPRQVLELGAYVGYSALRIARNLPEGGRLYSVEFNPSNADIARRIIAHAGASDRVTFIDGYLGDGGKTLARLATECGFRDGSLDAVFIDHDKAAYLPDLKKILEAGWLHPGSVVVADNVGFPGSPAYRAYMEREEGKSWRTRTHRSFVEYQSLIPDQVLESTLVD